MDPVLNHKICQLRIIQKRLHKTKVIDDKPKDKLKVFKGQMNQWQIQNCIDELTDNLYKYLLNYDKEMLLRTFLVLGDVYLQARDFKNAIYCSNHLRIASQLFQNYKYKIKSLLNLAKVAKLQKKLNYSLKFLTKALEYCWFVNDEYKELKIYDEIGLVYFQLNNIAKCKFYHQRSLNGELESTLSKQRKASNETMSINVKKFLYRFSSDQQSSLYSLLGFQKKNNRMYNIIGDQEQFFYGSFMDDEYLYQNITTDPEFTYQIQTPRNQLQDQKLIHEGVKASKEKKTFNFNVMKDNEIYVKKKKFIEKYNKNTRIDNFSNLRFKFTDEQLQKRAQTEKQKKKQMLHYNTGNTNLNQFYHMNHLSGNRNLKAYGYNNCQNTKIIDNYFKNKDKQELNINNN